MSSAIATSEVEAPRTTPQATATTVASSPPDNTRGPSPIQSMGVTWGGPVLLNTFMAAGAAATALGPLLRPGGRGTGRTLQRLAGVGAVAAWAYTLGVRPWFLRWGAQETEPDRPLPGDAIVPHAIWRSTRAVTIEAPAAAVWPWLAQMGQRRGGLYSYDWLENLAGLEIHSVDRIIPELQSIKPGDFIPAGPGEPEGGGGWTVVGVEPGQYLLLRVGAPSQAFKPATEVKLVATWAWVIEPVDGQRCRLIARWRSTSHPGALATVGMLMTEAPHFVMERAMLLGIKRRAEARYQEQQARDELKTRTCRAPSILRKR